MKQFHQISDPSNKIIIDWFSMTSTQFSSPTDLIYWLGLDHAPWQEIAGTRGFQKRRYFNGISVHYDHKDKQLIWLEMSGQGCRAYESFGCNDWQMLFDVCLSGYANITRLDIAYDDIEDELLDIRQIADDTEDGFYKSSFQYWEVVRSSKGISVMHGSPQSQARIRIYDKARERNCEPGTHWIRVELQLRDERALGYLALYKQECECFCTVIHQYLTYCKRTKDSNKSRWTIADYWLRFLAGAGKTSIYTNPGVEYNIDHLKDYVFNQSGNAIECALHILGEEKFMEELRNRDSRPNPKYEELEYNARGFVEI